LPLTLTFSPQAGRRWRQPDEGRPSSFAALFVLLLTLLLSPLPALAVNPDEILSDPRLEERARDLSAQLRCMVCQNQSIDDSNAELARDLRILVRERLVDGDSDEEVIDYVVSRYGEFVLLKPRLSARTVLLWGAPAVLLLIGGLVLLLMARGRLQPRQPPVLTPEEQARLDDLVGKQ
jgi:cytochrome c-type biogenesis protein CcmH